VSMEEELKQGCLWRKRPCPPAAADDPMQVHPEDFNLSSEEKRRIIQPEQKYLLSVFDKSRTSPRQVLAICGDRDPRTILGLLAEHLRNKSQLNEVTAHRDLAGITADAQGAPGADGHCGLTISMSRGQRTVERMGLALIANVVRDLDQAACGKI